MTSAAAPADSRTPLSVIVRLSVMMFLQYAIWGAWLPILYPFLLGHRGFTLDQVGMILMVVAVVSTVGKALLTGPVTRKWGEAATIKFSLIAGSVGYLVLLAAWDFYSILVATGFFILSKTLLRPATFALISKRSGGSQGTAMGLSNSFMSLGRIIGPIWAGFAYDIRLNLPYLSGSVFMLVGFLISLKILKQPSAH